MDMSARQEELYEALRKLTWVIETHSEAAWPIFDRLEKELVKLETRQDRLDRHRQKFG